MPTTIQIKSSETAGSVPLAAQLAVGELAVNLADAKIYSKTSGGTIVQVSGTTGLVFPGDLGLITDAIVSEYNFGLITEAAA
jgi:TRAP-type C4-dicarboxylate transport system permease large subunit